MAASHDILSTLNWLVEAGADEAIGQEPANRLAPAAAAPAPLRRPDIARPEAPRKPTALNGNAISDAQAAANAAGTLEQLRAALENFDAGALRRGATNMVFADGVAAGGILFIGEAPGRDEDRLGRPFVGRAGQLLDKMMAAIGLSRAHNAYITNVINWRPPDNRDPTPEEAAMSLPFLRRHIELVDPGLIILLGAVAARHVMGISDGIMKLRGRWMEYRLGDRSVPVLPTLHPAYLLRQPAHKKLAWRDLQAARAKMETLELPRTRSAG
jgi:DNA polymerase